MKNVTGFQSILCMAFLAGSFASAEASPIDHNNKSRSITVKMTNTTQGSFWPPSAMATAEGDFVVVGNLLVKDDSGNVVTKLGAAIVSKNTTPPLDGNGVEDFRNPMGAAYDIKRFLNPNNKTDMSVPLYTQSYGPPEGNWGGGGARIPRLGDSPYNLNSFHSNGEVCPELFPSESQKHTYTRPQFPLHKAPVWGFQGDQVSYDVNTGEKYTPHTKNGTGCEPAGCDGEDLIHSRRDKPITLGEWLSQNVTVSVKLADYSRRTGGYTAAQFEVTGENMLPNSIYHVVFGRSSFLQGRPLNKIPTVGGLPSVLITDNEGRGHISFKAENPFPAADSDDAGIRVIGVGLAFKSDYAIHGACPMRMGPGVDGHAVASTLADGDFSDFDKFVTIAK